MKNQMRALSPLIFSIFFFVLLVSCVRSSNVEAPSNSSSFDFHTFSLFDLFPPFDCSNARDNLLRHSFNSLSNLQPQNYDDVIKAMFGSESPFNRVAGLPDFRRLLERDLAPDNSLRGMSDDVNLKDLVQHASNVLFGQSIEQFGNFSTFLNEGVPDGATCTNAMAGRGECFTDVFGAGSSVKADPNSGAILSCIISRIPSGINLGWIMCECAKSYPGGDNLCAFLDLRTKSLACTQPPPCPQVGPMPYVPPEDARYANLPMVATLPTPRVIRQNIVDPEMQTYYLLSKSNALLNYDAAQASCDPLYNKASSIAGWNIESTVNLIEKKIGKPGTKLPFARLSSRPNKDNQKLTDYLITIRGAQSTAEWGVNFNYNKVFVDSTPVHHGFASLASTVWGPFQPQLQKAFDNGSLGTITITGFSLGGGVAAVLGLMASNQFGVFLPDKTTPRVRVVTFGAGRSGDLDSASALANVVVMRAIVGILDPMVKFPCDSMLSCPANRVPVPTGRDFNWTLTYADGYGITPIKPDYLPNSFSGYATNAKYFAWHYCAYYCWTSFHADPSHIALCLDSSASTADPTQVCSLLNK